MKKEWDRYCEDDSLLIKEFNRRNRFAFSYVYKLFYEEFYAYAARLYYNTNIEPKDIVQDVFIHIWEQDSIKFDTPDKIKAFAIIMIKNRYKNYLEHLTTQSKFREYSVTNNSDTHYDTSEDNEDIGSQIDQMLKTLPQDTAKVMRLYFKGYKADEIARELNITPQTVYNRKYEATQILRTKFKSRGKLFSNIIILLMCNNI